MIQNVDSNGQRILGQSFDTLPAYVFVERQGRIVYANLAAREALGARPEDAFDCPTGEIFGEVVPGTAASSGFTNLPEHTQGFESRMRGAMNRVIPVHGICNLADPVNREAIIIAVPYSAQNSSSDFLGEALSNAPEAIAITRGTSVLHINPEFTRLFGFTPEQAIGKDLDVLILPDHCREERDELYLAADGSGRASIETVRKTRDGDLIDVALLVSPVIVQGEHVGYYASYRDIRDRKQREEKLRHDALHDALTGLANRKLFFDRLASLTSACGEHNCFAVMFLDLDRFKEVNDTLGHAAGDEVLRIVAQRLRSCFRPHDTIARFGGDEFAILIENVGSPHDVRRIADRVERELAEPMEMIGDVVDLSASIGIVFSSTESENPEQILKAADYAMYRAKSSGGSRYEVFDDFMQVHASTQQQKEEQLRRAIQNREFEVWYQPVYQLQSGLLDGFEALLRWRRPDGTCVSFLELLPVAEETGLMIPIGREVIERACAQLSSWMKSCESPITMSVNVSARQFMQQDLGQKVALILSKTQVPAERLRLEIPESALNQNPDAAAAIMQRLVELGVQVVLDNFGSDLAALKHLLELPINMVKLDRRLISRLPACGRHQAFVEGLFDLGRALKLKMLAEGVETMDQYEVLCDYGCELAQGHLFAAPGNAEQATCLLQQGRWPSVFTA